MSPTHSPPPIDITTLYIPVNVADTPAVTTFGKEMHDFSSMFAHVSHHGPPAGSMISSTRGCGVGDGIAREGKKMVVHVLMHTWKNLEEGRRYKKREGGEYEKCFLQPSKEVAKVGLEWEMVQSGLEPVKGVEEGREGRNCSLM